MISGYRILEHPADLGLEARGRSVKEAFGQAALGMMSVIVDPATITPVLERTIEIKASDLENLLVRFLSEILFLYDAEDFLTAQIEIHEFSETGLGARARGETMSPEKHPIRTDIKAVTYHQLSVQQEGEVWKATVYFDV